MAHPAERRPMTVAEYLELEQTSEVRHEFINGEAYAMAGGTIEHATIGTNLSIAIGARLRGSKCRVAAQNQRIKAEATGSFFYPDLIVVCGGYEIAADDENAVTNPRVIVEVLSDSTEAYDRGIKSKHYKRIQSLDQYVLVHQHERRVEVMSWIEDGWLTRELTEGPLKLPSLEIEIPFDEIYDLEGVRPER